jgi:hypothetical protein
MRTHWICVENKQKGFLCRWNAEYYFFPPLLAEFSRQMSQVQDNPREELTEHLDLCVVFACGCSIQIRNRGIRTQVLVTLNPARNPRSTTYAARNESTRLEFGGD